MCLFTLHLLADDVSQLDPAELEARHHLSLIATSLACTRPVPAQPVQAAPASGSQATADANAAATQQRNAGAATAMAAAGAAAAAAAVSSAASPRPMSPSISLLELTSPEAVTAALGSAASANTYPVYMSTLHQVRQGCRCAAWSLSWSMAVAPWARCRTV